MIFHPKLFNLLLRGLSSLKELSLEGNEIKSIDPLTFITLVLGKSIPFSSLQTIRLNNNKIEVSEIIIYLYKVNRKTNITSGGRPPEGLKLFSFLCNSVLKYRDQNKDLEKYPLLLIINGFETLLNIGQPMHYSNAILCM